MMRQKKSRISLLLAGSIYVFRWWRTAAAGPYDPPEKRDVLAKNGVVAAAHPLAAQAGLEVLKKGGNAFDAAIGHFLHAECCRTECFGYGRAGGFAVIYTANDKKTYFIDYREMAPAQARPDFYPARFQWKTERYGDDGWLFCQRRSGSVARHGNAAWKVRHDGLGPS